MNKKEEERDILMRFKEQKEVSSEKEYKVLKPYAINGIIKFGFRFKTINVLASLTTRGKDLLGIK
ncbi:MAG: hypothetical protein U9O55_02470 [Patescibacteria group bacterium]|nr:hypothetical protein [Patescibacteria group bacterium]